MRDWLTFGGAVLGGVLGVVIGGVLQTSRRQRKHLAIIRQAEAHESARVQLGTLAARVFRWTDAVAFEVLGPELGIYDPEVRPNDLGPAQTLSDLREIRSTHPTQAVRDAAATLFAEISGCYAEPDHNRRVQFPTEDDRDTVIRHVHLAEALVELIQRPPAGDSPKTDRA